MFTYKSSTRSSYKKRNKLFFVKNIIKNFLNKLGINLTVDRVNKNIKKISFNQIYLKEIKTTKPIIFDVGACDGQSIMRFKDYFPNSIIHVFEPVTEEFELLKKKFKDDQNIILNNFAIGSEISEKVFNITKNTENSSVLEFDLNSKWIHERSNEFNTSIDNFITRKEKVKIITLDDYIKDNQIKNVDILKVDTEGYEDKVLEGAKNSLKENLFNFVEFEIIHSGVFANHLTWTNVEKFLIQNNYLFAGIESMGVSNIYESSVFANNVLYVLKK